MRYIVISFFISFFIPRIQAFQGKYPIQNFTSEEYKAGIQNIDFAQNRDMNLFVANNLGVLSYNGNDWELHSFGLGKKKRSLAFDKTSSRLYLGSQGEFGYFKDQWSYVSLLNLIPENSGDFDEVWDVFILNSLVYFCTFQGIYIYDGDSISVIDREGGFNRSFQANGKIFTQTEEGILLEIRDGNLIHSYPQNQTNQILAGVIPLEKGYLLVYNSGYIEYTTSFGVSEKFTDLVKVLQGTYVNHVLQISDARLAISTQTSGLFLFDLQNESIENITRDEGLNTNACLRSFQDYSGNLWIGLQNGIALLHINSPMQLNNQEINIEGSGYEVYEAEYGSYFSTSNGIYFLEINSNESTFIEGTEGPGYGIQKIAGKIYAGHHNGIFLLSKGKAEKIVTSDGVWRIKQLRSRPDYAIAGTYSGLYLLKIDPSNGLEGVGEIIGFEESSRFFEEDQRGNIWVGQYYKGLYKLQLNESLTEVRVTNVSDKYDIPIDELIVLSRVDDDLYLATRKGMYKLDQNTDQIVESQLFSKEIGNRQVHLFVQDKKNNVYVVAEDLVGFFKQISASNYVFIPSSLFQLRYFLNNDLLNISVETKNGVMFSANEGFIHYNPDKEGRLDFERPIVVRRVFSLTEDSILYSRKTYDEINTNLPNLIINQKAKVLQFDVESFQFNEVKNQVFRYYLNGFDDEFGEWTNSSTKQYTNLKEGNYEFIFQTRNYLGEIKSGVPMLLRVKPPIHRTILAKILYMVIGLISLLLVSRFQKSQYKLKTMKMEKKKIREIAENKQKVVEIEKQKEEELLEVKEAQMQSELHHLNNLLAASTMNLVVKNEFIENIREELEEIKSKRKNLDTKKALEQIVKDIDSTLRLQEDWEQFEHHFDQVHGNFSSRMRNEFLDLSPNDQKLCAFLRLNLNTKEISNLMSISLRGVEIARYRLRKKLNLKKGQNLAKFILEY